MSQKSRKQAREIAALGIQNPDINLYDLPEFVNWSGAAAGKFYRPLKKPVTVRLDADVLAWLKRPGKGYQTRINALLRAAMLGQGAKKRV